MNETLKQDLVRKAAIINDYDPYSDRTDIKGRYPLTSRGCTVCKGRGFYMNVVVKSDIPYLVAVPCECVKEEVENNVSEI